MIDKVMLLKYHDNTFASIVRPYVAHNHIAINISPASSGRQSALLLESFLIFLIAACKCARTVRHTSEMTMRSQEALR